MDPVREQRVLKALRCIPVIIALLAKLSLSSFSPSNMVYGLWFVTFPVYSLLSPPLKTKTAMYYSVNIHSAVKHSIKAFSNIVITTAGLPLAVDLNPFTPR
jgi:hypothetical protein